jgi:hypothetical protein
VRFCQKRHSAECMAQRGAERRSASKFWSAWPCGQPRGKASFVSDYANEASTACGGTSVAHGRNMTAISEHRVLGPAVNRERGWVRLCCGSMHVDGCVACGLPSHVHRVRVCNEIKMDLVRLAAAMWRGHPMSG